MIIFTEQEGMGPDSLGAKIIRGDLAVNEEELEKVRVTPWVGKAERKKRLTKLKMMQIEEKERFER